MSPGLDYDEDEVIVRRGRPMTRPELGCYSSHVGAWLEFIHGSAQQLIVFEDDVLIDWGFIEEAASHDFHADGIDYIRFAATAASPNVVLGEMFGRYLVQYTGYALGAQAYLLTRAGAYRMMERFRRVRGPVDDVMDQAWRGSLPNLGIVQQPVTGITAPSQIGAARNAQFEIPARLRSRRFWFRVQEKVLRKGYSLAVCAGLRAMVRGVGKAY